MQPVDYWIVGLYLVVLAVIGIVLARKASQSSEHYFLGGRALPWWALGASGMASNLDVAGTMTLVALIYLYGLHGFFIELRGGVVLPIAVFLAFMGKWHRRSAVMTTAEWMLLRFGDGLQGKAARFTAALTYLAITVAMTVYFFTAGGRFLAEFLPFTPFQCTVGIALVAFGYTLIGGLYGVVWTDVFQAGIIGGAAVYVAVIAARQITPELLAAWPGNRLNDFVPHWHVDGLGAYSNFGWFLCVWALKGITEGLGGSAGSAYMAQRYYAARSDAECQKLGMLWTVLFAVRWPLVLGFAILAVKLGIDASDAATIESIVPTVLNSAFFPPGVRGLMIAALLAAAMSTFDSTINAGASYLVQDIYGPLRPRATQREVIWAGYLGSAAIVALGLTIAVVANTSLLSVWVNIVMLLFPAFLVPFALRWYWARFNGAGFAVGIAAGFLAAWLSRWFPTVAANEALQFVFVAGSSLAASLAATFAADPVPESVLRNFHARVRPFGWWPRAWRAGSEDEHRCDGWRVAAALIWQLLTFLIPMGAVLGRWPEVLVMGVVWIALFTHLVRSLPRS
ncbi:sodium:solute symporter [Opitutaceae bacterium EW11]|nr:sodium:solute symporter [Opitutaceae bacterium EW11]